MSSDAEKAVADLVLVRPMLNAIRLIVALSLLWLVGMWISQSVPRHESVDAILPARVLAVATREERQQIAQRVTASQNPSVVGWVFPVAILLLGNYALFAAKKSISMRGADEDAKV